jgi:DNA primase
MTYSDEIKSRLTAREVFEFYGFNVNRAGFVCCPLHGEKTPSLKVYPGDRGWHCFGCHAGGDVLDFVQLYFGLNLPAACEKLNDDFNLGLPIGKPLSRQEQA